MNKTEIGLRKELWWVYANILYNYGKFDKKEIEQRMEEIRFPELSQKTGSEGGK